MIFWLLFLFALSKATLILGQLIIYLILFWHQTFHFDKLDLDKFPFSFFQLLLALNDTLSSCLNIKVEDSGDIVDLILVIFRAKELSHLCMSLVMAELTAVWVVEAL